jgi:GNAT superfamily N-acetyltransferase
MAADLRSLNERWPAIPGLNVELVADAEALGEWGYVRQLAFGTSQAVADAYVGWHASVGLGPHVPLRNYVGRLGGEAVAACSMLLTAGSAGIHHVATVPEMRGRGIGTAIVLTALRDARAAGHHVGVLGATEAMGSFYRRLGFDDYCTIELYVWDPG